MSDTPGQLYTINSVKVQFPWKAYPSQLSMMDKVTRCAYCTTIMQTKLFSVSLCLKSRPLSNVLFVFYSCRIVYLYLADILFVFYSGRIVYSYLADVLFVFYSGQIVYSYLAE